MGRNALFRPTVTHCMPTIKW